MTKNEVMLQKKANPQSQIKHIARVACVNLSQSERSEISATIAKVAKTRRQYYKQIVTNLAFFKAKFLL